MSNLSNFNVIFTHGNFDGEVCWSAQLSGTKHIEYANTLDEAALLITDSAKFFHNIDEPSIPNRLVRDVLDTLDFPISLENTPYYKLSAEEELDLMRKMKV